MTGAEIRHEILELTKTGLTYEEAEDQVLERLTDSEWAVYNTYCARICGVI